MKPFRRRPSSSLGLVPPGDGADDHTIEPERYPMRSSDRDVGDHHLNITTTSRVPPGELSRPRFGERSGCCPRDPGKTLMWSPAVMSDGGVGCSGNRGFRLPSTVHHCEPAPAQTASSIPGMPRSTTESVIRLVGISCHPEAPGRVQLSRKATHRLLPDFDHISRRQPHAQKGRDMTTQ